jgi:hypothetical protein
MRGESRFQAGAVTAGGRRSPVRRYLKLNPNPIDECRADRVLGAANLSESDFVHDERRKAFGLLAGD